MGHVLEGRAVQAVQQEGVARISHGPGRWRHDHGREGCTEVGRGQQRGHQDSQRLAVGSDIRVGERDQLAVRGLQSDDHGVELARASRRRWTREQHARVDSSPVGVRLAHGLTDQLECGLPIVVQHEQCLARARIAGVERRPDVLQGLDV